MFKRQTHQRPAAVLILAMLLMSAIIGSSIALSVVISDSSKQTRTLNDFVAASIAADSGLERGLAIVKLGRIDKGQTATTAAVAIPSTPAIANNTGVTATTATPYTLSWPRILPRESVTFDYIKGSTLNLDEQSMKFVGTSPTGTLDVSWVGLDASYQPRFSGRTFSATDGGTITASINLMDIANPNVLLFDTNGDRLSAGNSSAVLASIIVFRIRLTAVQTTPSAITSETITNVSVGSTAAGSPNLLFPSRIKIDSTGRVNNSQATKSASVAWQLPTSPVFNYVLFSETDIIPSS